MDTQPDDVRKWHFLRRNHRTSIPSNLMFVDTETIPQPIDGKHNSKLHTLRCWTAITCRMTAAGPTQFKRYYGTTANSFWQIVDGRLNDRKPLWLFAHNLGFDATVLGFWDLLELHLWNLKQTVMYAALSSYGHSTETWNGIAVIDDPPTILKVRRGTTQKTMNMVDTLNFFRTSVAEIGKCVGLEKLPMPEIESHENEWAIYCHRDTEIIFKAVTELMLFVVKHELGTWGYTIPSQAYAAYRHRFLSKKILIHGNKDALEFERKAYYGGRLQQFYAGRVLDKNDETDAFFQLKNDQVGPHLPGPVYVLDIQSCYPAVMCNNVYPAKILKCEVSLSIDDLIATHNTSKCCIAHVRLNTDQLFPVHRDNITFMATGRMETYLCGPELIRAANCGAIAWIGKTFWYQGEKIFDEYINYFWKLRQEYKDAGNTVYSELCKLFMNSLFGKFGQRARRWENDEETFSPRPWGLWSVWDAVAKKAANFRSLAWLTQKENKEGESFNSAPAIAAYVTSYGREYVNSFLLIAGVQNCYYMDTDSLHVNNAGLSNLMQWGCVEPGLMGRLRLVGTYATAEYRALKDYTIGDNLVVAGIRINAEKCGRQRYKQDQFQRIRSILAGKPQAGVCVDTVSIDRRDVKVRGTLGKDGRITPPVLQDF